MIKRIALQLVVIFLSMPLFGQTTFGVRGGLNLANMKFIEKGIEYSNKSITGLMMGGFVRFDFTNQLSIQPELLFTQNGSKISIDNMGDNIGYKFTESFISIPLAIKYTLGSISIKTGPQVGLLLTASNDGEDAMDGTKRFEYGIIAGVCYETNFGIGLEGDYYLGFTNINNDNDLVMKNSGIQLSIFYRFK